MCLYIYIYICAHGGRRVGWVRGCLAGVCVWGQTGERAGGQACVRVSWVRGAIHKGAAGAIHRGAAAAIRMNATKSHCDCQSLGQGDLWHPPADEGDI